jgi:hypothetical protein
MTDRQVTLGADVEQDAMALRARLALQLRVCREIDGVEALALIVCPPIDVREASLAAVVDRLEGVA